MSPSARGPAATAVPTPTVARVMGLVTLALLPGVLVQVWIMGVGRAWQVLLAVALGLGVEALMLRLRGRAVWPFLSDLSAPVTAILLTLLLPLATPWWMLSVAVLVALVLGKHLYGGLGENLFNPAMVGYATLLVVFPANFSSSVFSGAAFTDRPAFTAASFALGGLFLIVKKIIPWQTPLAMLGAAVIAALALNAAGLPAPGLFPQSLFSGSLALAAFFIVTDPVTGCISPRGRLYFAAGAGLLTVTLGRWSNMSDGLPFAILLMNAAVPWLDRTTRPSRSKRVQVQ